jgi:hypothetical protein
MCPRAHFRGHGTPGQSRWLSVTLVTFLERWGNSRLGGAPRAEAVTDNLDNSSNFCWRHLEEPLVASGRQAPSRVVASTRKGYRGYQGYRYPITSRRNLQSLGYYEQAITSITSVTFSLVPTGAFWRHCSIMSSGQGYRGYRSYWLLQRNPWKQDDPKL